MFAWPKTRARTAVEVQVLEAAFTDAAAWQPTREALDETFSQAVAKLETDAGSTLAWADLALVEACLRGSTAAVLELDRRLMQLRGVAARFEGDAEELLQQLRASLLTPPHPRLRDFGGRSTLASWLKASVVNLGLSRQRQAERSGRLEASVGLLTACAPQSELVDDALERAETRERLRAALHTAMSRLSRESRLLLRQHHLDLLTLEQLAAHHQVHRATIARWLGQARAALIGHVETELRERMDEVLGEVGSRTSLSLRRLLLDEPA